MRQLIIQVPKGQGKAVLDLAKSYNGANLAQFEANNNDGEIDVVIVNISNREVEKFLGELGNLSKVHIIVSVNVLEP